MRRWAAALGGTALVVAAWGTALVTPDDAEAERPFSVPVEIGDRGEGRNLAVTVTGIRAADAATIDGWDAEGPWLIVDLEAAAVQSDLRATLSHATLSVDGRTYRASERPPDSMFRSELAVGVPRSGSIAFELPEEALGDDVAVLSLGLEADPRLDSLIEVHFEPSTLDRIEEAELMSSGWAR
ncbi:hypothetical protein [Agromyces albus]|uniref:DUF4352 domain-containing protein n=1 Tax=Agromyces albus TaxID=205332 RepID=A0A4Q2L9B5_9MICO|nr:hypothetical protein [Agromyces albus]RXZ73233.1 hypothetical protein ESP51_00590 [Agromyces albus]